MLWVPHYDDTCSAGDGKGIYHRKAASDDCGPSGHRTRSRHHNPEGLICAGIIKFDYAHTHNPGAGLYGVVATGF